MENIEFRSLDFIGYHNYRVGDDGSIWSKRCKRLENNLESNWKKLGLSKDSYIQVSLYNKGKKKTWDIHILVLLAFFGYPQENQQARHLDGNKYNNQITNLKWGTAKENYEDMITHGTDSRGERNGCSVLTTERVKEIRQFYKQKIYTQKQLSQIYNTSIANISLIVNYKNWRYV